MRGFVGEVKITRQAGLLNSRLARMDLVPKVLPEQVSGKGADNVDAVQSSSQKSEKWIVLLQQIEK